jgi:dipeptidyl aminopeptidase/acylaminoacyl peptidase
MSVAQIPLDVLLGNPVKAGPQISPDGKRLSYLAPVDGVLNVWVGPVGADDASTNFRPVTNDTDRGINQYAWCHDNKHLLYVQDQGGNENWRIYTVDLDSGKTVDRTPFEDVQAQIVADNKRFPHELLIGLNKDNPQLHDVYHLDLRSGELKKVAENPGFLGWVVDDDLKVRAAMAPQPDGGAIIVVRDDDASDWRPLLVLPAEDALVAGTIGFSKDGKSMFVFSSVGANASRLLQIDAATGETIRVLAEDPTYDVIGAMTDPDTLEPQLAIMLKEKVEYLVLDESIRDDIAAIQQIRPGAEPSLVGRDDGDRTWLVTIDSDARSMSSYVYDRDTKQATLLFENRPELNDYELAPMEPFSFKARDGLEIHGYITFPVGVAREKLPTVINVHGGPWARDSWGFHPEAQWLANRGYVCVQVNFRSSIGYGKDFLNAGNREWGAKMQDDVTDTRAWVIEQGYADPDRVCIYGGSYGGYAALAGATFTPDLYRCAISMCGISNLNTWIQSFPPYWAPMLAMIKQRVGDIETEEEFLWSRSPLSKVGDITVPMLIAQGGNDPRVTQAEAEQIVDAMKAKGIDHEYLLFEDEGHGFVKPENRLKFYEVAEGFLAKHL